MTEPDPSAALSLQELEDRSLARALSGRARERLKLLAQLLAPLLVVGLGLRYLMTSVLELDRAPINFGFAYAGGIVNLVACLGLWLFVRREHEDGAHIIKVGLCFEVLVAMCLALPIYATAPFNHWGPSWLTVWIVFFPLLVPAPPRSHWLASFAAAAAAPVAYYLGQIAGEPDPTYQQLAWMFLPNVFAVFLAAVPAKLLYETECKAHQAQP